MVIGNIYLIAAISIIGGGLFGFDISSMSAIIGTKQYLCYFNQGPNGPPDCSGPRSDVQGGITASMAGGSWLGALCSGFLSDIFGRKHAIIVGACIWLIGSTIICASQNIGMLIVGRVINGFCVGICSAQVPVYISELAPPSKRGRLVGAQQWAITWGIMIMFYISYGCSHIKSTASFRIPWGLQMIPAMLLIVGMLFLPESPRWLARNDRWEEAESVLALVHSKGDRSSAFVQREMQDIREMCEFERENRDVSYLELFRPRMINRTHIGVFTQIWSQLTGMNVMMYYITYVFAMAGLTGNQNLVSSSIQYVINVVMTIPALLYVDRWGRRPTLLIGAALMMTWLFADAGLLATYGHYAGPNGVGGIKEASWSVHGPPAKAVIACSYLFVASFAPTWGPVSWIYPPELYPLRVRGKAVALATSANWAFNFALGYFVPPAFVNIQWKTYLIFGVFCFAMFIHVFFMFPETAGKTLEETDAIFTNPHGVKYIGTPAWKTHISTSRVRKLEKGELDAKEIAAYHDEQADLGTVGRASMSHAAPGLSETPKVG
ncbi:general substrate transporter [Xylona heveae TC161]|uniref:General substrate transporter n=1 Tax=Xylona heveae (strain CBS 132557 / TC161) TaxID=1328760 RepID=A0A165K2T0_XYLHT|nr:general substrate transporter [Xylona heveae TC161]KZF26921.1 general substrate transporter [Xylona heveae TC161]